MTTDTAPSPEIQAPVSTRRPGLLRHTAWGTGVGIELREKELVATIIRVRPSETGVLGAATVTDFRTRPAAEWGAELHAFLRKLGVAHIAANVLLPRRDVLVRSVYLPGVSDRDLESAIRLQIDSLHPFADEEVCFSHTRLPNTAFALVGIVRRSVVDSYNTLFAEAGLKVASLTFSAGAVYSALRVITQPPPNFIAAHPLPNGVELYGESEARSVYSAMLPMQYERAVAIARSELRLDPATPSVPLSSLLPRPSLFPADYDPKSAQFEANVLPYATALAGACPWLGLETNLLPPELRRASSRVRLIPTVTLGVALLAILIMLALQQSWADSRYLAVLQHQIQKYEPAARKVDALDKSVAAVRARSQALDDFKRRGRLDIDALAEITRLIPPPGWVSSLDMDRNTINIGGEADQAEALLKIIDKSPYFDKSELTMPISRAAGSAEMFRIRAQRTVPSLTAPALTAAQQGKGPEPAKPAAQTPAAPAAHGPVGIGAPNPFNQAAPPVAAPKPGGAK